MKYYKRFLSILVASCMVFTMLLNLDITAHAENQKIDSVTIVALPAIDVGSSIADANILVTAPEGCTVKTVWYVWDKAEETYIPVTDGNFDNNSVYWLTLEATPEEGYSFSDEFQFIGASSEVMIQEENTLICDFGTYSFTTVIDRIEVTASEVAAGNTASIDSIVVYAGGESVDPSNYDAQCHWCGLTGSTEEMDGWLFEDNQAYQIQIKVEALEGYSFSEETVAYVNGVEISGFVYPNSAEFFEDYSLLAPIESVELQGLPKEEADAAMNTLTVVSELNDSEVYIDWLDENEDEITGSVFEAGKTYYLKLEFSAYGYAPISENFVFIIDGVEYVPNEFFLEGNQAWLNLIYKIPNSSNSNNDESSKDDDYDYEEDDDYIKPSSKPSSKPSKTETKPAETTKKPNPSTGAEPTGIYRFFALSSLMAFSLLVSKKLNSK